MLMLITGVPGHGKTLRALWHIRQLVKEGRTVYSDIDGLCYPGVEPAPADWRDTPEGAAVVYDEAQRLFGSDGRGAGRSAREDIQAFETHRHTGHDIYLITQHPNLIHAHVRRLVGRHEHVCRIFGRARANIRWQDRAWEVDKPGERRAANTELWAYPSELYAYYKSATIHQNTARIPRALKIGAVVIAFLAVAVGYSFSHSGLFLGEVPTADGQAHAAQAVKTSNASPAEPAKDLPWIDKDWADTSTMTAVGGCIATDSRCRCFTVQGKPIQLTTRECQRRVRQPLPYAINASTPGGARQASAAKDSEKESSIEVPEPPKRRVWNDGGA